MNRRLRLARLEDTDALLAIYAPYVRDTAITFEYDVPDESEFAARIRHVLEKFPYLVAEAGGELVGNAYAGAFHPRAAYQWCAEMSVYVKRDARRMGIGKLLYAAMEEILRTLDGLPHLTYTLETLQAEENVLWLLEKGFLTP